MLIIKKSSTLFIFALSFFITFKSAFSLEKKLLEQDRSTWNSNDYWEETQLNFKSLVYGVISNTNCKSSIKEFIACVAVMNKIYDLEHPKNDITINIDLTISNDFIKTKTTGTNPQQYLIDLSERLNKDFDDDSIKLISFSFNDLLEKFETNFVTIHNDSETAAIIYNTYLTVAKDPHSYIMPLSRMQDQSKSTTKSKGIGIFFQLQIVKGVEKVLITEVLENSPAQKAGIINGDIFLTINSKKTYTTMLREIGDVEKLATTILRNKKIVNISIVKGEFVVKNVQAKLITKAQASYGYIKLRSFSDKYACFKIRDEIRKFKSDKRFKGLILDLRNNGGGLKTQATCIMEQFLEPGSINWMEKSLGENTLVYETILNSKKRDGLQDFHSAVLINGYSASASEALSMYLQDYQKSFIVGERSFGKGSVQSVGEFPNKDYGQDARGILKAQTQFLYYGPKGISPQLRGVTPDIVAYPKIDQREKSDFMRETDLYAFPIQDREVNAKELIGPTRRKQVLKVKSCLQDSFRVKNDYDRLENSKKALFDNQLETAIETISCANKNINVPRHISLRQTKDLEILSQSELRIQLMRDLVDDVVIPEISIPELEMPEIELPELKAPEFSKPDCPECETENDAIEY